MCEAMEMAPLGRARGRREASESAETFPAAPWRWLFHRGGSDLGL